MVLKLREQLIKLVAIYLPYLPAESYQRLTADQRERIIRWLTSHDRLSPDIVPYITKNLLSVPLYSLEFYKCNQLTNDMLIEFAKANHFNRLKSLIIHQCNHVQGRFESDIIY
jgi:predicted YcjX-like family ATPase